MEHKLNKTLIKSQKLFILNLEKNNNIKILFWKKNYADQIEKFIYIYIYIYIYISVFYVS